MSKKNRPYKTVAVLQMFSSQMIYVVKSYLVHGIDSIRTNGFDGLYWNLPSINLSSSDISGKSSTGCVCLRHILSWPSSHGFVQQFIDTRQSCLVRLPTIQGRAAHRPSGRNRHVSRGVSKRSADSCRVSKRQRFSHWLRILPLERDDGASERRGSKSFLLMQHETVVGEWDNLDGMECWRGVTRIWKWFWIFYMPQTAILRLLLPNEYLNGRRQVNGGGWRDRWIPH